MNISLVYITTPNEVEAKSIAQKLIVCANILPQVTALYTWNKKIEENTESVLIVKTKKNLFAKLQKNRTADTQL